MSDYEAEAQDASDRASELVDSPYLAGLCRIAAAVYERLAELEARPVPRKYEEAWTMMELRRIIAAGEGAAKGEPGESAVTGHAGERGGEPPSPVPSPKRPQDYRKGDTLPLELRGGGCSKPEQFTGHSFRCTRHPHTDSVHLAYDGDRLCCDPYGDDGQPWVEPSGGVADVMALDAEFNGRVALRRETVLALARALDVVMTNDFDVDSPDTAARLLREDAGEGA